MIFHGCLRGPLRPCRLFTTILLPALAVLSAFGAQARKVGYVDKNGQVQIVDDATRTPWPTLNEPARYTMLIGNLTVSVVFCDVILGVGHGFDDPTSGSTRRTTALAAVKALFEHINESGACLVQIDLSESDGAGPPVFGFGYYPLADGFVSGDAFQRITTGVDSSIGMPEVEMRFDFGYPWNEGLGPPESDQWDLYSFMLRETMRPLGIDALTTATGESSLFAANGTHTFTTFENLLYTGNGKKLWNAGGVFAGIPSDLTGGDGGVLFHGTHATARLGAMPRIFAPNPFEPLASIKHWEDIPVNGIHPLLTPTLAPGEMRRTILNFELGALQDIGYHVLFPPENAARDWQQWR